MDYFLQPAVTGGGSIPGDTHPPRDRGQTGGKSVAVGTDAARRAALEDSRGRRVRLTLRREPTKQCPAGCGSEDQTEYLICVCPAYAAARQAVFGTLAPPLTVLQSEPAKVLRYLQRIGRIRPEDDKPPATAPAPASAGAGPAEPGATDGSQADAMAPATRATRRPTTGASQRRGRAATSGRESGREAGPNGTNTSTNEQTPRPGRPRVDAHVHRSLSLDRQLVQLPYGGPKSPHLQGQAPITVDPGAY
eukprot:gene12696-biopygen2429